MIKNESNEREEADNKNLESVSEDLNKINEAH
jgi:hypothetical protein